MEAFGVHFLKEISRSQLQSAAKSLLQRASMKELKGGDKATFLRPLALAFIEKGIVKIKKKDKVGELVRDDVRKVGTF